MNVRCCFLFGVIFAIHATITVQLPHSDWYFERCECLNVVNEVCGSDDATYMNLCELDCASAFTPDLTFKSAGPCPVDYNYCYCPEVWDPVCGSDGLTYRSFCDLRCSAETYNEDLYVDYDGECPPSDPTQTGNDISDEVVHRCRDEVDQIGLPCSAYSAPDRLCNATLCESEEKTPLCGNDGVTYKNYCDFCCTYFRNPGFKIILKGDCNAVEAEDATTIETTENEKKDDQKLETR